MKGVKTIGLALARTEIFFFALLWLMLLLVVGTVAQKYVALYQATHLYFTSILVWLGPIPLPGGFTTMALIFINLLAKLIFSSTWRWNHIGVIITHLGVLLLLLGGLVTGLFSKEGQILIYEGESSNVITDNREAAVSREPTYLPFSIKLVDFHKEFHPGTDTPRKFSSEIIVKDQDSEWPSVIQMNQPLRYRGYTFYQSSYIDTGTKEATILTVVQNVGRLFPYVSSIAICLGLLIQLCMNLPKLLRKR